MEATYGGDGLGLDGTRRLSAMGGPIVADASASRQSGGPGQDAASSGPTFRDILHALNPLQHLPVVGMIYRAVTGDTISPAVRIAGSVISSLIMGGPIGVLGTALGCLAEEVWNRGWNQPGGATMPLSYSAGAEAAISPQATLLPPVSDAPSPPYVTSAPPAASGGGDPPRRVASALAAYARADARPWTPAQWQASERG